MQTMYVNETFINVKIQIDNYKLKKSLINLLFTD